MRDNLYTFGFAAVICVCCSFVLSLCAESLRPLQEMKVRVDIHKNILLSVGITGEGDAEVEKLFEEKLKLLVIDKEGNVDTETTPEQLASGEVSDRMEVYLMEEEGEVQAYVIPVKGVGLWGPIFGYLAIEPDCNTVRGVTFFAPKETPGLGSEIVKPEFQDQFKGKHILDGSGNLVSIRVVKGKAKDVAPDSLDHAVDGVSGATITCDGVSEMIENWLNEYEPYFSKVRKG
jgi:Na+-transporting NADH:ubiquinone oxidoreductase subunit C